MEVALMREGQERVIRLQVSPNPSVALDLVMAQRSSIHRAAYSALALAWRGPGRPKASLRDVKYDVLEHGGQVIDEMTQAGYRYNEAFKAGLEALKLFAEILPDFAAVEEEEGNSEAPAGA